MTLYQLALLGSPSEQLQTSITECIKRAIEELGMTLGKEVTLHVGNSPFEHIEKLSAGALYFGAAPGAALPGLDGLLRKRIPIIPVASEPDRFAAEIPSQLRATNGVFLVNSNAERLTTILLEAVGLLPKQRRIFLSYKRDESRDVALQLFEALSGRLFDVFLDTHGIAEGASFQEVLWHKLCDCDVVVMLDTPNYFSSRWTRGEFGRALVKSLVVLRVGWPGVAIDRRAQLARDLSLENSDFASGNLLLTQDAISKIALELESARTTSIATRYRNLVGSVSEGLEKIGGAVTGIGMGRRMNLRFPDGTTAAAFPAIGVPTSAIMQDAMGEHDDEVAIVFDHFGVKLDWLQHMEWLENNIKRVRWVRGTDAPWVFADWEPK
jgi:hypothetical protein